jgi:hypothetical protein
VCPRASVTLPLPVARKPFCNRVVTGSDPWSLCAVWRGVMSVWCGVVWCGVVWCGVVWCGLVWCGVCVVCVARVHLQGTHTAMKTGMLAAEATYDALTAGDAAVGDISAYQAKVEGSWVWEELKTVRNYQPSFQKGLLPGMLYSGLSGFLLKGREPWTFHNTKKDSEKVWVCMCRWW